MIEDLTLEGSRQDDNNQPGKAAGERPEKLCPWDKEAMQKIFLLEFWVGEIRSLVKNQSLRLHPALLLCLNLHHTCIIGMANLRN